MFLVFFIFVGKAGDLRKKIPIPCGGEGGTEESLPRQCVVDCAGKEVNYRRDKYFVISWQKVQQWAFEVNALSPASKWFHVLLLAAT